MNRRRLLAALSAGAATALAGCTSGDGGGSNTTSEPTTAAGPATTENEPTTGSSSDATVQVRSTDEYGDVLVDADGMALYLFDPDEQGESTCYDDCAQNWPPLTVDGDPTGSEGVTAELGTTERDDGSRQVTANGWPLYYFAGDEQPGDTNGQGLQDVWWLLTPAGERITSADTGTTTGPPEVAVRSTDEYGDVLVDAEGMSLYLFDPDDQGESTCYDDCAQNWPPLTVDGDPTGSEGVTAELGTTERDDGSRQVTANGWPLYYFAGDEQPGDTNGQGLQDVWWLLTPAGERIAGADGGSTATTTSGDGGMY